MTLTSLDKFKRYFSGYKLTEEHHEGYCCKNICHKDMRCIDLPDAQLVCGGRGKVVLTEAVLDFLRGEVKKLCLTDPEWAIATKKLLKQEQVIVTDTMGDKKSCKREEAPIVTTRTRYCSR